jgi:hypothetical protein
MPAPQRVILLSILFCWFVADKLAAQGVDIRGVVTDSLTNQRIPYANIVIVGHERGTAANRDGVYLLTNIPLGEYEVAASAVGYRRQTRPVVVQGTAPIDLNFQLAAEAVKLGEVTVTGTQKSELQEITTSIHILDKSDLHMVPVTGQSDFLHLLQILPGIVSTSDASSKFFVRGGAGDQNLFLVDGMKIYNPFHALGIFSVFDPDIVNTVEVYTGAPPPGYGGRLSSVVDIATRDGRTDRVSATSNVTFLSSKLQVEGPISEQVGWMMNGRTSLLTPAWKKFFRDDVPVSFYDLFFKATMQTHSHSKLTAQALVSGDRLRFADPEDPDYRWQNLAIGSTISSLMTDRVFVNTTVYANFFTAERDPKRSSAVTPASTSVSEPGLRAIATLHAESGHLYFFGMEFSFPKLDYDVTNTTGVRRHHTSTLADVSASFRHQGRYGSLQVDGGVHIDLSDLLQGESASSGLQPRIQASYPVWGTWKVKSSYGRLNQKVITVTNEDDLISIFDAWIRVPANLRPEGADHYVLGIDGNITELSALSLQAYYKDFRSLVTYNQDKIDATQPDYVNATGEAYGVEALVRYKHTLVDMYASYTLGRTSITSGSLTYAPRYDRRHQLNLLGQVHLFESLDLTVRWEYGSGLPFTQTAGFYDRLTLRDAFPGQFELERGERYVVLGAKNAARLPSYHRLDLSVMYRLEVGGVRGILGVNIVNVYDRKNIFYFERKTGQRVNMMPFFPSATLTVGY